MSSTRHGTLLEREALHNAARCITGLIDATRGDNGTCASFDTTPCQREAESGTEYAARLRQYYMDQVRIYVESWILPPVKAAAASMSGEPSSDDMETLRAIGRF